MDKKIMNPLSPITEGQIGKICEILAARLRKNKKSFANEPTQKVLEQNAEALVDELEPIIHKYIDAQSNMIVRHVQVNRKRAPQEALDATGRKQYVSNDVVANMPKGEGEETDVFFFKMDRYISDEDLEKEYDLRGLKPDPLAQCAVNEADPLFADTRPNGTHWKNAKGKWCFVDFDRWDDEPIVRVGQDDYVGYDYWWFGGVRKQNLSL